MFGYNGDSFLGSGIFGLGLALAEYVWMTLGLGLIRTVEGVCNFEVGIAHLILRIFLGLQASLFMLHGFLGSCGTDILGEKLLESFCWNA